MAAAPVNPTSAQLSRAFYALAIDVITILSNLNLPSDLNSAATGIISSTTANTVVLALAKQRDLY